MREPRSGLRVRELRSTLRVPAVRLDLFVVLGPEDRLAEDPRPVALRLLPCLRADLDEDRFELADFPEREGPADVVASDGPHRRAKAATNTSIFRLKTVIFLLLIFLWPGDDSGTHGSRGETPVLKARAVPSGG